MKVELVLSERLEKLLRPLTTEEFKKLEENILEDGEVLDPILYWNDGSSNLVVDGMHRLKIARKHDLPYREKRMSFVSLENAEVWILDHADGRRHIEDKTSLRKLRGDLYNRLKRPDGGHGPQKSGVPNGTPLAKSAAEVVAEKHGGSVRTVKRDGKYAEALEKLTPPIRKILDEGTVKVTDAQVQALAKADPDKQQKVAREVRTGAAQSVRQAMDHVGIKAPEKKVKTETICDHSWVSDGNGERYCDKCKEDHPDNSKPKKRRAKVGDEFKKVDDLYGKLFRALDDVASGRGKKGKFHKQCQSAMDSLHEAIKAWKDAEPEAA